MELMRRASVNTHDGQSNTKQKEKKTRVSLLNSPPEMDIYVKSISLKL